MIFEKKKIYLNLPSFQEFPSTISGKRWLRIEWALPKESAFSVQRSPVWGANQRSQCRHSTSLPNTLSQWTLQLLCTQSSVVWTWQTAQHFKYKSPTVVVGKKIFFFYFFIPTNRSTMCICLVNKIKFERKKKFLGLQRARVVCISISR